jgi:DAACS family dicarboxylate/amino acid:cation (Na+ or H+) symporter
MALGLIVGPLLGAQASPLGEIGKLVIQLIKAVATPLLFFAIVNAILKTEVSWKQGSRLLMFAALNASIALVIGMTLSNALQPGQHLNVIVSDATREAAKAYADKRVDLLETLSSYVPKDWLSPFANNQVIPIVLIALLLGFGLRAVRNEQRTGAAPGLQAIEDVVGTLQRVMEIILTWVITLIPLAVFGVVAKTTGEYGYAPLKGLAAYVVVGLLGLALHIVLTYQAWVRFFARIDLRRFWRAAREPAIYALGTNSSLATLPVTLKALDELGVRKSSSAMGACVGTNLNNDGIVLYEGMAVLFVAQACGVQLNLGEQLLAAGTALIAAMGVAGVPEAGFISLALVLSTVGLPLELLPLLLTVDWVIARARSLTNALSDMVLSILIDQQGERDAERQS